MHMWLQKLTDYLLSNRKVALLLTLGVSSLCVLPGGALFAGFGMIFAAFVTLVRGPREGAIFTLAATIPYAVLAFIFTDSRDMLLIVLGAIGIVAAGNILTWVCASMLHRKSTWGQILQLQALLGVFAVSVVHLVYPDIVTWWSQRILTSLTTFTQMLASHGWSDVVTMNGQLPDIALSVGSMATGFMVTSILAVNLMQLLVARWWQSKLFMPGALAAELRNIRISRLAGLLFLLCFGLYYFGNAVISDIMPIIILTLAVAGLSLMHYYFNFMPKTPSSTFIIVLIYTVIFVLNIYSMIFLASTGLVDIWVDFRRSIKQV